MQLNKLTIYKGNTILREVEFKLGLNLILDKPASSPTSTGNSVGKTTLLRLIDFCLGSDGDDIWTDSEFRKINQDIYNFLIGSIPVTAVLIIKNERGGEDTLRRTFSSKQFKPEIQFSINDTTYKNHKAYNSAVKQLLFGSDSDKPSLRQLAPKFVRSSVSRMANTLKFLGDFGKATDYEATHLFLFGFFEVDVLESRLKLAEQIKKYTRDLDALTRQRKEGEIEQLIIHLQNEITEFEQQCNLQGEVPEIAARATMIAQIRSKATTVSAALAEIASEKLSIEKTIEDLRADFSVLDLQVVETVYREAGRFIPDLHHELADVVDFISKLRNRKQAFLRSSIKSLDEHAAELSARLNELFVRERRELDIISEHPEFTRSIEMRTVLQDKYRALGGLEKNLTDITETKSVVSRLMERFEETRLRIESRKQELQRRVAEFNKHFSALSKELYGEQYLLHFEETAKGSISFQLASIGSNVGSGKKVTQTAAFDLAYIQFVHDAELHFPTFVCHDGIESIHDNQLSSLLHIADSINGQFIVSTLRDKLPSVSAGFIEKNTILELSPEDKFFKL